MRVWLARCGRAPVERRCRCRRALPSPSSRARGRRPTCQRSCSCGARAVRPRARPPRCARRSPRAPRAPSSDGRIAVELHDVELCLAARSARYVSASSVAEDAHAVDVRARAVEHRARARRDRDCEARPRRSRRCSARPARGRARVDRAREPAQLHLNAHAASSARRVSARTADSGSGGCRERGADEHRVCAPFGSRDNVGNASRSRFPQSRSRRAAPAAASARGTPASTSSVSRSRLLIPITRAPSSSASMSSASVRTSTSGSTDELIRDAHQRPASVDGRERARNEQRRRSAATHEPRKLNRIDDESPCGAMG